MHSTITTCVTPEEEEEKERKKETNKQTSNLWEKLGPVALMVEDF
jgi:hypothetical protein